MSLSDLRRQWYPCQAQHIDSQLVVQCSDLNIDLLMYNCQNLPLCLKHSLTTMLLFG